MNRHRPQDHDESISMNEAEARRLLGVAMNASPSELKSAYRRMVKLWHPDRFAHDPASCPDAIRQTQRINHAYRLLEGEAEGQGVQNGPAEARSTAAWQRSPIRRRVIRNRIIVVVVSAALYVGLSWVIHDLVLGF